MNEEQPNPNEPIYTAQTELPGRPVNNYPQNFTYPAKRRKLWPIVVLSVLLIVGIGAVASYFLLVKNNVQQSAGDQTQINQQTTVDLTPDAAFAKMLENNLKTKSYSIKVDHKSSGEASLEEYNKQYSYTADVDINDLKKMKLSADFEISMAGKQAKGKTIWAGEDIYLFLTESLVTDYKDVECSNQSVGSAVSPLIEELKSGYTKTARSELIRNCGYPAYSDFISVIHETNLPFSDFPLVNGAGLSELEKSAFEDAQAGIHKIYDGQLTTLDGVEAYSYNVIVENYEVVEVAKILGQALGYTLDDRHFFSGGTSNNGFSSPGRYLKVWISKDSLRLIRVQSIIDTPDTAINYTTTIDYSNYDKVFSIEAPSVAN
jgi:hypothetical protein